jgi:hypothetical protein
MFFFEDESGTASDQQVLVIGLVVTPDPTNLLDMIKDLRAQHQLQDELHFWKHSARKLRLYQDVLDGLWQHDVRYHAIVVYKSLVDRSYFGNDKYLLLNHFTKLLVLSVAAKDMQAALYLDARERQEHMVEALAAEVNALVRNAIKAVIADDSKHNQMLQIADLLTGVVHHCYEPPKPGSSQRKELFCRAHLARLLLLEQEGRVQIWRWRPGEPGHQPPTAPMTTPNDWPSSAS